MANTGTIHLKKLGENIRFLRNGKAWTLADLARESGISKAYISDLENGSAGKPNIQYIYSVACSLGVTLDQLIDEAVEDASSERIAAAAAADLPAGLAELKEELNLTEADVERLATIQFRGKRPRDKEGWRYLINTLNMLGQPQR